jgi:hypothetical protein
LVATQADNINIAKNKPCTASSGASHVACENIFDGVEEVRNDPIFHSGQPNSDWVQVDLGAEYFITKVVIYNRINFPERLNGAYLQLLDSNRVITGQRTLTGDMIQTFVFSTTLTSTATFTPVCDSSFENGGWLLVRRAQGSSWGPSTDRLLGLDVYGVYGAANSASTFSIAFSSLVTPSTEFLFITGIFAVYSFWLFKCSWN